MREKYFLCNLFIEKNDPVSHICVLQKYVLSVSAAAVTEGKVSSVSCTITCKSFSPFLSAEPLKLCDVGGFPPMNCLLRSFHNILIGLKS